MTDRSSHFHARYKISEFAVTALARAKIPGLTIKRGQIYPLMNQDFPLASVNALSETATYISFRSLQADLDVVVLLYVQKTASAEEDIAWFSSKIQAALLTNDKLLRNTNLITPSGFDLEFNTDGEKPVYIARLTFTMTYTIIAHEPFKLEEK